MSRIDQVNSMLLKELAALINNEIFIESALVTLSFVDCSPDLSSAKVGVSVFPEMFSEKSINTLKLNSSRLAKMLNKKIKLKKIPKLIWIQDRAESQADEIGMILKGTKR